MVLQLFIGLLIIAAASLLITQGRRRRIWSVLILAGLCGVSYLLLDSLSHSADGGFIYQWLPYKALKADFNISSSQRMQQMFFPLLCLLAASVYLNTVFVSEQHSLHFNTLMLFNFIGLILQASSHDFLQLMFAGSMLSIISFYMPDLSMSRKRLFVFNFLAEMSVFMALAIVYGKTGSISLGALSEYARKGWHKDLVAGLLMFAIGCKCGLFLLNGQYFSLKDAVFNRIISIMSLSVPLSGLILLAKLQPLLLASNFAKQSFSWWVIASLGVSVLSALINNNIKSKAVALSLSVYSVLLLWIYKDTSALYHWAPLILMLNFLAILLLCLAFNAASEETSVWRLGGFWHLTRTNFILSVLGTSAITAVLLDWFNNDIGLFVSIGALTVLTIILRMIYFGATRALEKVSAFAKNAGFFYTIPLAVISLCLIWQTNCWQNSQYGFAWIYLAAVFMLFPVGWLMRLGNLSIWQNDILSVLYINCLIMPLRLFGRILWLAFDVVVIERNVIGSVSTQTSGLVERLRRVQEIESINFLFEILIGLALMGVYLGYCIYE